MYCVMRVSVPSLYNVYRRYDICVTVCSLIVENGLTSKLDTTYALVKCRIPGVVEYTNRNR